jgi:hypothetical protein
MTRSIARLTTALFVPVALLAFASPALAKDKKPVDVKEKCEKEVREKLKHKFPHAHDFQLTSSREWQPSSTQSGVGGTGTYLAADKKPRNFEWSCTYDNKSNKITDVNVEKPKKAPKAAK